jgi:predicted NUDIX family NTP pyrophosphohydrolase
MQKKKSAGILLYRLKNDELELLLVHPGGPFWKNKDAGSWSIPKGEFTDDESPLEAARRELEEETSLHLDGAFIALDPIRQKSGKMVYAWALEADIDPGEIKSNTFEMEWPPRSGKQQEFPEIDRAEWFSLLHFREKMIESQAALVDQLVVKLNLPKKK